MPRPDDSTDGPSTLPQPELNPLLNPILGQNMARWAEVYFTSPPEKREQAVLDLLHELQAENSAPEIVDSSPASEQAPGPITPHLSRTVEVPPALVRCQACGWENPSSHRFCVMCGTSLAAPQAAADLNVPDHRIANLQVAELHSDDLHSEDLYDENPPSEARQIGHSPMGEPAPLAQKNEPQFVPPENAVSEPAWKANEILSTLGGREFDDHDHRTPDLFEPLPASRPYGLYIGIAAALVLVLVYVAWRSTQGSQSSKVALQATPAVTTPPAAPAPTLPNPSNADAVEPIANGNSPGTTDRTPDLALPANPQAAVPAAQTASATTAVDENSLQGEPVSANGAQELAIAQRYLNGADGQQRNSSEAAKWLWKAMAKHNAEATFLLSDLYLKGDGVEKNCDQARVLLDAAAIAGMKAAGERLRHLQAFGCQ